MVKFSQEPIQPLPSDEWDFSGCPVGQATLCWGYEFARNVPWICSFYASHIKDSDDAYVHGYYVDLSSYDIDSPLWLPPGFPDKTFLRLDESLKIVPPFENLDNILHTGDLDLDSRSVFIAKSDKALAHPHCYNIFIRWDRSPKKIKQELSKLIDDLKPEDFAFGKTGGRPKDPLTDLQALGVYRLDRHYGGFEKAQKAFSKIRKKPPTSNPSVWSRMKNRAAYVLRKCL